MAGDKSFAEYLYNLENLVDEFVIAFISFGAITVSLWAVFFSGGVNMQTLGSAIEPWITMLALMLIARELWFINRHIENGNIGGEN